MTSVSTMRPQAAFMDGREAFNAAYRMSNDQRRVERRLNDVDWQQIVIHNIPRNTSRRCLRKKIGRSCYFIRRHPGIRFFIDYDRKAQSSSEELKARIIFGRVQDCQLWLGAYGGRHPQNPIMIGKQRLGFTSVNNLVDRFSIQAIKDRDPDEADSDYNTEGDDDIITNPTLQIRRVDCGSFDEQTRLCVGWSRKARTARSFVSFDVDEALLRLCVENEIIEAEVFDIAHIYLNRKETRIYFAFKHPPRFLRSDESDDDKENPNPVMAMLEEDHNMGPAYVRLSAFDDDHRRCAPYAVIYRAEVCNSMLVLDFFERTRGRLSFQGHIDEQDDISVDHFDVKKMTAVLEKVAFRVAYQAQALVAPHKLMAKDVVDLQKALREIEDRLGAEDAAEAVRSLRHEVLERGPHVKARNKKPTSVRSLAQILMNASKRSSRSGGILEERRKVLQVHTVNLVPCMGVRLEGPHADEGNRILRQYKGHEDEFLRVRITEEDGSSLRLAKDSRNVDAQTLFDACYGDVFKRVGLTVAGRRFYFLAYGNSGLRECICWFVRKFKVGDARITAATIRDSIGDLRLIRNPARYAARLGQAFSSSSIVIELEPQCLSIEDDIATADRRYEFTDGIGMCSPQVLDRVNEQIGKRNAEANPLSAFQVRIQGAKGMLAVNPRLEGEKIVLRRSMVKFRAAPSDKVLVEVSNWWSRPLPVFLNRQIVTLLETLDVEPSVFLQLQKKAVEELEKATLDPSMATTLHRNNGLGRAANIQVLIDLLNKRGINAVTDIPFLHDVNISFINFALRRIKYAARIVIDDSVTLVGVVDETGVLRDHQIVACLAAPGEEPRYLKGSCLVGRSPMLAPGDIQRAVAIVPPPKHPLRALRNVVIFASKGDRPLPTKLSGGDLDGDLYNVIQHPDLLKVRWTADAANYARTDIPRLDRDCTIDDIADFFLDYMKLEKVGVTASRHLQVADQREAGAADPDCVKLAELHSIAVDFGKTGINANLREGPRRPNNIPDFMQKEYRLEDLRSNVTQTKKYARSQQNICKSEKALGQMFRDIDVYAQTNKWKEQSIKYTSTSSVPGEVEWSCTLWSYLEKDNRHSGWIDMMKPMTEAVKTYFRVIDVIAQDHCPEDKMQRLSEEEVFMGHVMNRGPHGTRMSAYDMTTRLQDDFEDLCLHTRAHVLTEIQTADEQRELYEQLWRWLVIEVNLDVTSAMLRKHLNALSERMHTDPSAIATAWDKHLRTSIKRGIAFIRAGFDSDEGRSAAWIMIPSIFVAHNVMDALQCLDDAPKDE